MPITPSTPPPLTASCQMEKTPSQIPTRGLTEFRLHLKLEGKVWLCSVRNAGPKHTAVSCRAKQANSPQSCDPSGCVWDSSVQFVPQHPCGSQESLQDHKVLASCGFAVLLAGVSRAEGRVMAAQWHRLCQSPWDHQGAQMGARNRDKSRHQLQAGRSLSPGQTPHL